jgi:hypothetical protein
VADQAERRNGRDGNQCGYECVLDSGHARLIVDEICEECSHVPNPFAYVEYTPKLQGRVLRNRKKPAATAHAWRRTDAETDERCFSSVVSQENSYALSGKRPV